ncbi:hypothetical protein [Alloactinosynnema sp. L-07]|nr:hypothetical protein [Alloactinosynnema sp. L-07]
MDSQRGPVLWPFVPTWCAEPAPSAVLRRAAANARTGPHTRQARPHLARVRCHRADDAPQEGGLARPVRPRHRDRRPCSTARLIPSSRVA